jgi:hypothetical protein
MHMPQTVSQVFFRPCNLFFLYDSPHELATLHGNPLHILLPAISLMTHVGVCGSIALLV